MFTVYSRTVERNLYWESNPSPRGRFASTVSPASRQRFGIPRFPRAGFLLNWRDMRASLGLVLLLTATSACSPPAKGQGSGPGKQSERNESGTPSTQPATPGATSQSAAAKVDALVGSTMHAPLHAMLRLVVRDGLVDYAALAKPEAQRGLAAYLDTLAEADPKAWTRDEHLAALINLYNAAMLVQVTERRAKSGDWTPAADEFAVFDAVVVRLPGVEKPISLNQLENEVIRKDWTEPRIHVALVCAARSCPPLIPRAYVAADLESTLQANMQRFIDDASRNEVDATSRTLKLSKLFEWYAADFGGPDSVTDYVNAFTKRDVKMWTVEFKDYDWSLNVLTPAASAATGSDKK